MDGKSKDLITDNIEKIKVLFPEAVAEVADKDSNISYKIDMEKLSILLGEAAIPTEDAEYYQKYGEKFAFEWSGKRRAIAEAQKRSTGTLRPCPEESVDWENTENLYIEGDNLEVLKLLQDSYMGAIKMIYIDPPYNTGKDFVYKDNYKDNLSNYLEQTNTTNAVNSEASGRYHTNWLNMMYPRLKLARNLLTDDGVIFISIDDNEVANLRKICDEVFGEDNFVTEFVWEKKKKPSFLHRNVGKLGEYVLCYTKKSLFSIPFSIETTTEGKKYPLNNAGNSLAVLKFPPKSVRFNFQDQQIAAQDMSEGNIITRLLDEVVIIDNMNENEFRLEGEWRYSQELLNTIIENKEEIIISKIPFRPNHVKKGGEIKKMKNFFSPNHYSMETNEDASSQIIELFGKEVFSYPKPIKLIQTLIQAITYCDSKAIVLDFFSGSGTTAQSLFEYNMKNKGERKFILVQLPENLDENIGNADPDTKKMLQSAISTLEELNKPHYLTELAKERIRRAGKKILKEHNSKDTGLFAEDYKLDIGFKVFKLDRSNVKNWDIELDNLKESDAATQLKAEFNKILNILKPERTELDILYEVMLKLGLSLTTKVEEKEIEGKKAFVVGSGVMVATFAKKISYKQIGQMLDLKADFVNPGEFKFVIADESFADSKDKTNALQLFKQRGITNYEII
ncbi:adenine-specific DNA-methyltransferase [Parabacteroides sp. PFB2-10]|uniref:site-specific DNA-methyltransferase n=1 Tax=Parabacteroides sp. PFB2-10 TaxID=1742405 RepID=UPI0024761E1D|nr:site-specific DNA-methyltransferase [Parabacteroides sp. PFB2-10]MDH6312658.1 adenine-specific DNA-methyltransferase [Parabacteroides sp. PFB2-10]